MRVRGQNLLSGQGLKSFIHVIYVCYPKAGGEVWGDSQTDWALDTAAQARHHEDGVAHICRHGIAYCSGESLGGWMS